MNKRRNKSITKTQHRVQKTKKSRRLNKNRSVKGIRGNNKTKVVGKRRNIVQRGGGRIDDLVGRIFELDAIQEQEILESAINMIMDDVTVDNTQERTAVTNPDGTFPLDNTGMTLLYAACRLENNPSSYLVSEILKKMQDQHTEKSFGGLLKEVRGIERSSSWNAIKPNGKSKFGSYPQHGAVQAARKMLENYSMDNEDLMKQKLDEIIKILRSLQKYDDNVPKPLGEWNSSLMGLYNAFRKTAYQEFNERYRDKSDDRQIPSVEDLIEQKLPKYKTELIKTFEEVLKKPKRLPYPHAPPPQGKAMGGNV